MRGPGCGSDFTSRGVTVNFGRSKATLCGSMLFWKSGILSFALPNNDAMDRHMKQPWEWEEDDINRLIQDGVQESLNLDYKRCASLDKRDPQRKVELSKDVSSFANSDGGTLVYGVIENNHLPERIDDGYDPSDVTREWIDQVITSTVQPRIDGFRIKQIVLKKVNPGKVIYVVSIPKGRRAHMAADRRYWKRYEYNAVMMEDYEIRDVNRREESPDLQLYFNLPGNKQISLSYDDVYSSPFQVEVGIRNLSPTPAMYTLCRLYLATSISVQNSGGMKNSGSGSIPIAGSEVPVNIYTRTLSVPATLPIWEGIFFNFTDIPIELKVLKGAAKHYIVWELHSPAMTPRQGLYSLQTTPMAAFLTDEMRGRGAVLG
jgi:hypothetical protein